LYEIRRKVYRRGSSHETTIPQALLLIINPDKKYNIVFKYELEKNRWYLEFEEIGQNTEKTSPGIIKRKLYSRTGSFETTIPRTLFLTLDPEKKYYILFKRDSEINKWYIEFELSKDDNKGGVKHGKR